MNSYHNYKKIDPVHVQHIYVNEIRTIIYKNNYNNIIPQFIHSHVIILYFIIQWPLLYFIFIHKKKKISFNFLWKTQTFRE